MTDTTNQGVYHPPAPGKECGACSLCCKVMPVRQLDKPAGVWCQHICDGGGCGIYATRPSDCRVFYCHWMTNPELSQEWKPEGSNFVIFHGHDGNMRVMVDPDKPDAWKARRFYAPFKSFAAQLLQKGRMLSVHIGERIIIVLPDADADVGIVPADHRIAIGVKMENGRPRYQVRVQPIETQG